MRMVMMILLCIAVASCGVKPKKLESPDGFPASYPQE